MSEQFKDSPLGRIPKGWRSTTLGEAADYINGFAFKPHHWRESGLPIIRIAQMLDPLESVDRCPVAIPERHVVQDGELLFSWSATLAVVVWDRGPALVNQHIFRVVPRGGIHRNFLYHLLSASMDRLAAQSHGTTMKHVTRGDLLPFAVVIPPEDEQCRIADVLDTVDDAIRQTERVIAKLEQVKVGMLQDLLTRGIDDNGEVRDPERHPEQFKDSPLGRIPKGWTTGELNSVVDSSRPIVYGILMPGPSISGGVPVVKVKDIRNDEVDQSQLLLTSRAIDFEYRRSRLQSGDLLFTIRGTVGRMAFVPLELAGGNITQDTARLAIVSADPRFVRHYLAMPVPSAFIETHTIGQAVKGINLRELRRVPLALPPVAEQCCLADQLSAVDARVRQEHALASCLRSTRAGLADDLLTGRVRVNARVGAPS